MTFATSEIEEVESAAHHILEVSSWMDWWICAAWSVVLPNCIVDAKCYSLFVAGA